MKLRGVAARRIEPRGTRDLILDVAERHFAERGFAGVSVREIAGDSGLKNQASLYHHFRNKRALYEAVLARGLAPIVELVAASGARVARDDAAGGADADNVAAFLDLIVSYLEEHPHLPRLIQRAALDDSRYLRIASARFLQPLYVQGLDVLRQMGGPWPPEMLPHLAAGLYHLIFAYFANARLLELVTDMQPLSPAAMLRQRRFLRAAVIQLLSATAGTTLRHKSNTVKGVRFREAQ
jgi:AcrR family transcriptional regulator